MVLNCEMLCDKIKMDKIHETEKNYETIGKVPT